jgi:DNA-binding transcriptional ArsR family regulator
MAIQAQEIEQKRLFVAQSAADIGALLDKVQPATELLKSLSHETRFSVLCQLAEGEKSVAEMEQLLQLRQPALSQQLARLRDDGLVNTRRDGRNIYYSLARNEVREVILALHRAFCGVRARRRA